MPIVATYFDFNSEVLGASCLYYEPKNAKAAAQQFQKLVADKQLQEVLKGRMLKQLAIYGDYDAHFNAIEEFLIKIMSKKNDF